MSPAGGDVLWGGETLLLLRGHRSAPPVASAPALKAAKRPGSNVQNDAVTDPPAPTDLPRTAAVRDAAWTDPPRPRPDATRRSEAPGATDAPGGA